MRIPPADPPPEAQEFDCPQEAGIPLDPRGTPAPDTHLTFDGFWQGLGLPDTPENGRLRELFYEWLGQNGYDVHRIDEPTIIGDRSGWQEVWARYLRRRRLT